MNVRRPAPIRSARHRLACQPHSPAARLSCAYARDAPPSRRQPPAIPRTWHAPLPSSAERRATRYLPGGRTRSVVSACAAARVPGVSPRCDPPGHSERYDLRCVILRRGWPENVRVRDERADAARAGSSRRSRRPRPSWRRSSAGAGRSAGLERPAQRGEGVEAPRREGAHRGALCGARDDQRMSMSMSMGVCVARPVTDPRLTANGMGGCLQAGIGTGRAGTRSAARRLLLASGRRDLRHCAVRDCRNHAEGALRSGVGETSPSRPSQQRAGAPSGAPGLLLCREAGVSPALLVLVLSRCLGCTSGDVRSSAQSERAGSGRRPDRHQNPGPWDPCSPQYAARARRSAPIRRRARCAGLPRGKCGPLPRYHSRRSVPPVSSSASSAAMSSSDRVKSKICAFRGFGRGASTSG